MSRRHSLTSGGSALKRENHNPSKPGQELLQKSNAASSSSRDSGSIKQENLPEPLSGKSNPGGTETGAIHEANPGSQISGSRSVEILSKGLELSEKAF
jgi:hypothetical protein